MEERSENARKEFLKKKDVLADQLRIASKDEVLYDGLITDITELVLSGESIARNPETVGSSSKSLTVMFWNLGNWNRGNNVRVPAELEYQKLFYKDERPDVYPEHVAEDNNLFLQMVKNLRAHVILNCEATTLLPYREYLEKHGWTLCYFSDTSDLCCLARLGHNGSIRQIEEMWNGPKRRVSCAIYEIVWGKAISRGTCAASERGYFAREDDREYEDMCRARMTTTRLCIYHVDNVEAGKSHSITGECLAQMMYECVVHQVTIIGGDANRMAYQKAGQQLNSSFSMSTFQFWLDRVELTLDRYFKKEIPDTVRDMNIRQFHTMSFLDLMKLPSKLENKVDTDSQAREETQYIGDCCMLTFFEFGFQCRKIVFGIRNTKVMRNTNLA